jgi:DNA-binding LacI/PurR family transcriptional regulator/DNA-binding transcriptional regulator YhcF (GntR family)
MLECQPGYLRVRQGVYNLIENNGSSVDRIPTEFELCKMFEVSRSTVRRALKLLVGEGFLISRPGIGTFVSSEKFQQRMATSNTSEQIKIGYTHEAGRLVQFDLDSAHKFMPILEYLTERNYVVDFFTSSGSPDNVVKDLQRANINYLIWTGPFNGQLETLHAIKAAGIKLILLETYPWEGFNVVGTDGFKQGYLAAKYLLERGRRNLLYVTYNMQEPVYKWKEKGFRSALKEYGLTDSSVRTATYDEFENVCKYGGKIDGIFCQSGGLWIKNLEKILTKYKIEVPENCEIVTVNAKMGYPAVVERLKEAALFVAQKMVELVEGEITTPFQKLFEPELIESKKMKSCRKFQD